MQAVLHNGLHRLHSPPTHHVVYVLMIDLSGKPIASVARHVRPVAAGTAGGASRKWAGVEDPETLDQILAARTVARATRDGQLPLLLLAPSGSGKSFELARVAQRLVRDGHNVVAIEARRFLKLGFQKTLDQEERSRFGAWRETASWITILVDAVDEIALDGRTVNDLEHQLVEEGLIRETVQLVLSSRNDVWSEDHDRWLNALQDTFRRLRTSEQPLASSDSVADSANPEQVTSTESPNNDTVGNAQETDRLELCNLSMAQVRSFAEHYGLAEDQSATFIDAVESSEVSNLFSFRPRDVELLKSYWLTQGDLNSWRDILSFLVRSGYQELNQARGRHRYLTLERYVEGIRRVAALIELSSCRYVLHPSSPLIGSTPVTVQPAIPSLA